MNETVLILIVVLVGFAGLAFLQFRKKDEPKKDDETLKVMMEWMKDIKQGTEITRVGMQKSIDETNKAINERLDNAGRVIAALTKELGSIGQVGPDIRRLTETLASPKLRGNFRSEEHTSELQSQFHLVCRLLLAKKHAQNTSRANIIVLLRLLIIMILALIP